MILKNKQYKHLSKDCVAQDTKELLSDIWNEKEKTG